MMMIIWLTSSHKNFNVWETLSIDFDCILALSIIDVNTEFAFSRPAGVLCVVL